MQRLPEEPIEDRPAGADLVGSPDLPQNLSLAGDHRVESGSDAEQMQRRGLVPKPIERRPELCLEREQGCLEQKKQGSPQ